MGMSLLLGCHHDPTQHFCRVLAYSAYLYLHQFPYYLMHEYVCCRGFRSFWDVTLCCQVTFWSTVSPSFARAKCSKMHLFWCLALKAVCFCDMPESTCPPLNITSQMTIILHYTALKTSKFVYVVAVVVCGIYIGIPSPHQVRILPSLTILQRNSAAQLHLLVFIHENQNV